MSRRSLMPVLILTVAVSVLVARLASAAIQLTPVITGLASPVFVTHAGDGTNRLFIEEQAGIIRVLHPGAATAAIFLDIRAKVRAGGEQGLLGLAFHPQYASNGRFFVFYNRAADGALVIAEYRVSGNPDQADPAETILLVIPHPTFTNHNGGMLAFGPNDGYLYIGVGDGGGGNDPGNNAQNIDVLLGKILRIDVDRADPVAGTLYAAPPDNPFVGGPGRDEIFSFGWRNPWRFSFDTATFQQWVADVGQNMWEEVDSPIVAGGNYGWRVYEGLACTNVDPALCDPALYLPPLFAYNHSGGRCSITGGHVYRGTLGVLPIGMYVYGDYCTGEIFGWNGSVQAVLLDTTLNITSFGLDEAGEIYVVHHGGTLSRITSGAACTYSIAPTRVTVGPSGSTGTVAVTTNAACAWTAVSRDSWINITGGASGSGSAAVTYSVAPYTGRGRYRNGSVTIAGQTFSVRQSR